MSGSKPVRQSGVVLIVALLGLTLFALVAGSVLHSSVLQLRMAGNDESSVSDRHRAQALIDGVFERPKNFTITGAIGHRNCVPQDGDSGCDQLQLFVPSSVLPERGKTQIYVERQGPLTAPLPVLDEQRVSSSIAYAAAKLEIHGVYESVQGGRVHLVQGVLVRIATTSQGE